MNDEIKRKVLAHRHAVSVERALSLTRSEESCVDVVADAFGRWIVGPEPRGAMTQIAPAIEGEVSPPLH